jgi:formylglycine-generating enzyme required for sulfatase activity
MRQEIQQMRNSDAQLIDAGKITPRRMAGFRTYMRLICIAAVAFLWSSVAAGPADYTEKLSGTLVEFDLVAIPAGRIVLPDPEKKGAVRAIRIKAFRFGKNEVTWDEYDVYARRLDEPEGKSPGTDAISRPSRPYGAVDRGFGHKGYPAISISYHGAEQYCKWLSAKTGHTYRLPTEAEWEFACRARKPQPDQGRLSEFAWFGQEKTHPVGQKSPNPWGIYDMLGNVGEWCTDLSGKPVLCGGSYEDKAENVRPSAHRYQDASWLANDPQDPKSKWWLSDAPFAGFRVVRID